ncbi:hypothetical protein N9129_00360 [Akkermansiaceae bacterium]|nr:hypothetical protein [Akkermansiaceae bacterium]
MRLIALLISTTLALSAGEPTEALLQLLEKAKSSDGKLEKLEGLAISRFVGPNQKKAIEKRWVALAAWAKSEEITFSAASEKVEGDLAVVLAAGSTQSGLDDLRIFGFGLLKGDSGWKIAPSEGTFENAGLSFAPDRLARARELESWLGQERVLQGEKIRQAALDEHRKKLAGLVDEKILKDATPEEAVQHFLKATFEKKNDAMLVWQGILERSVVDDYEWDRVQAAAKVGLEGKDDRNVWRLLTSPNVIRLQVSTENDDDETSVLIGFISTFKTGMQRQKNRVIRFHLENHGVGWRVKMPAFFSYADENASSHYNVHQQHINWRDNQFSSKLTALFEEENKARRGKTPEDLLEMIVKDLGTQSYSELVRLLYRDPAPEEGEKAVSPDVRYNRSSDWWNDLFDKKEEVFAVAVKVQTEGDLALGILKTTLPGDWNANFSKIWMRKTIEGWSFLPSSQDVGSTLEKEMKVLDAFYEAEEEQLKEQAEKAQLADVGTFVSGKSAPAEKIAREVVTKWRESLVTGESPALLAQAGMVKIPEKVTKIFRDLSSAMKGARAGVVKDQLIASKSEGPFHAVSMMVDAGRGLEMHCPLIIVAETEKGPRVLIDIELWLPTNRGKKMRNASALIQLKKDLSEADYASLKLLFDWHDEVASPVWDAWDKERNEKN